jgi:hypothetical protein
MFTTSHANTDGNADCPRFLAMIFYTDCFSHDDSSSMMNVLNTELLKLSEWFKANKVSINIKKSNYMIFKPRQKRQTLNLYLEINNHKINRVKEVVFLGVILDENMSWKPHISHVARKVSKSIGIIYKSSFCLSKSALRTLYFSKILCMDQIFFIFL